MDRNTCYNYGHGNLCYEGMPIVKQRRDRPYALSALIPHDFASRLHLPLRRKYKKQLRSTGDALAFDQMTITAFRTGLQRGGWSICKFVAQRAMFHLYCITAR